MSEAMRAVISISLLALPVAVFAQAGPSDPQIIAGAPTAKINVGSHKLAGQLVATVRVDESGRVRDVLVTENSTDSAFEQQLVRVLQSAHFRPGIDAGGKPVESSVEMKVELRTSTGATPKPVAAKPDPQLNDKEKARIRAMKCSDYVWEWQLLRDQAGDAAATELMPRIAIGMYIAKRAEAKQYVDGKVWKASAKALKETAKRCEDQPQAPFFEGMLSTVLDKETAD